MTLTESTQTTTAFTLTATTTSPTTLYDCEVWLYSAPNGWPTSARSWCCNRTGLACPTSTLIPNTTTEPYDCWDGRPQLWPSPRIAWCCQHYGLGCTSTTTQKS